MNFNIPPKKWIPSPWEVNTEKEKLTVTNVDKVHYWSLLKCINLSDPRQAGSHSAGFE
jgi:hypothetical protein